MLCSLYVVTCCNMLAITGTDLFHKPSRTYHRIKHMMFSSVINKKKSSCLQIVVEEE